MFKFCDKCNTKINFIEKFKLWKKNTSEGYTCECCKTKYKPTELSMQLYSMIIGVTVGFIFTIDIGLFLCFISLLTINVVSSVLVIRYKAVE
ncbi:hypothetical protein [Romboutsia lituseburensis]|uniref:Cxxc_20_cxxc protein n=1 Tax=Romboutsia lituseburensis DSM 797 TaxID=1121325 RepID=A0A1G9MMI6_9FIRM|nr:hypothetical protein [Romboutsia lituseburensis]CEH34393.1 Hypothetical protein RLITU_1805 [Romboutsia lituseburensis]SDL75488.1 hypothetical protein SAMN04515677_103284 [Romboutsia lituseburensis DSM 797]